MSVNMNTDGLRKRVQETASDKVDIGAGLSTKAEEPHPAGEIKHGIWLQITRAILAFTWFMANAVNINVTQFVGSPLYFINKDFYYAFMALTKQSAGIVFITITQWFSPTTIRVSWDSNLRGEFRKTSDGRLETSFPERLVLIANHQIYTDWLYLWWIAYTSKMHGHLFIILKESLKYIPFIGPGMMFYGFIFMARKWASDKSRLEHRLQKLKTKHRGPMSGSEGYDPMWLLIFPEGTNLSANTRKKSVAWSKQSGTPDMKYQLLPRATGLFFCLQQLKGTVDWVYDCTIAYEGTPRGGYAQDYFTIRSLYLQGRPPRSVNLYWRKFAVSDIPLNDQKDFEKWIEERWREKDELLEQYNKTSRFPADLSDPVVKNQKEAGYINTEVKLKSWLEIGQLYVVLATVALLVNIVLKTLKIFGDN